MVFQFENSSLVISNRTMSDDTPIPFFDETQQNSINEEKRTHPPVSRQRTRNYSGASERGKQDNESTVTVRERFIAGARLSDLASLALSNQTPHQVRADCGDRDSAGCRCDQ